jgi:hypothetical protein
MPAFNRDVAVCAGCGCSDLQPCSGGCCWLAVNRDDGTGVCSNCPKSLTAWRHQQVQDRIDALPPDFQRAADAIDAGFADGGVLEGTNRTTSGAIGQP